MEYEIVGGPSDGERITMPDLKDLFFRLTLYGDQTYVFKKDGEIENGIAILRYVRSEPQEPEKE